MTYLVDFIQELLSSHEELQLRLVGVPGPQLQEGRVQPDPEHASMTIRQPHFHHRADISSAGGQIYIIKKTESQHHPLMKRLKNSTLTTRLGVDIKHRYLGISCFTILLEFLMRLFMNELKIRTLCKRLFSDSLLL